MGNGLLNISSSDYFARKGTVQDYTANGQCSNCGGCCTDFLPMDYTELAKIKRYVAQHKITPSTRDTLPGGIDMTCPFLDVRAHQCTIYAVRPAICKGFLCSLPAAEVEELRTKRLNAGTLMSMRKEIFRDTSHLFAARLASIEIFGQSATGVD